MAEYNKSSSSKANSSVNNGFQLDDISIKSIARDVWRRILLVVLAVVVFAGGFYIFKCETYKPQYTSNTTFLVSTRDSSNDAYSNLNTTVQLNQVFKMILDSSALQESVKRDLGLNVLDATITASVVEETNLLVLTVTAGSPLESYKILNSVIDNYPTYSSEVMGNAVMDVFDPPSVPTKPNNSVGGFSAGIMGAMVGAALSLAIIVVLSFLKDTVKNERQVEDKLDTKLYATIPHEKRRKRAGLLVSDVLCSFGFEEAYNKLRSSLEREQRKHGYKCFAIASALENEGKTTVAANLAIVLARQGYKVLLIDFDLRRPAVKMIFEQDIDEDKEFSEYFANVDDSNVKDYIIHNKKNKLDLIVSSKSVNNINRALKRSSLNNVVNSLRDDYDYIIVDTPPIALVSDIDDVISSVDASLVVVREDSAKAMIINDSIDILTRTDKPLLGAVLNDSVGSVASSSYGYAYYGRYSSYGYGRYGRYGKYGKYGKYNKYARANRHESSNKEDK